MSIDLHQINPLAKRLMLSDPSVTAYLRNDRIKNKQAYFVLQSTCVIFVKKNEVSLRSERSLMLKIYQCVYFAKRNKSKISKLILCFSRLALILRHNYHRYGK